MHFIVGGLVTALLVGLTVSGKVPVRYNLRYLLVHWRRTLRTALAFTLVVSLLTVMLAFVNGMHKLAEGSGRPGNVIVLAAGGTDELFSHIPYGDAADIEYHAAVLRDRENLPLASWEVYFIISEPPPAGARGENVRAHGFLPVRGLDDPLRAAAVHGLELHPGGAWFSDVGAQASGSAAGHVAIQAVLGEGIARTLGKEQGKQSLQVGDAFEAGARKWVVVGILNSGGATFDSEIWARRQVVGPIFGKETHTTVVLRTADAETARATANDLNANYKKCPLQALVETDYYSKMNATSQQFLVAILVATIAMGLGGALGVMNTMFATIAQRTKDIAVMRILGFARWQIVISFFLEALCIAVVGGLLGCALGALADGATTSSLVGSAQGHGKSLVLKIVVDGDILLTGMLFAVGMGCVGGLAPALSAMWARPLHALR